MNIDTHSIFVTEQLLPTEDLSDKKKTLKKPTEEINDIDEKFLNLVNEVIADDQKGKIVDQLKKTTKKYIKHNQEVLEEVNQHIDQMVMNLDEQVDDIKEQQIAMEYQDLLDQTGGTKGRGQ